VKLWSPAGGGGKEESAARKLPEEKEFVKIFYQFLRGSKEERREKAIKVHEDIG